MRIDRRHTSATESLFEGIKFRVETSDDWQEYTVPAGWSRSANDILIAKVFHKDPLPSLTRKVPEEGVPDWLWRSEGDDKGLDNISAEWRHRYERDVRDVIKRMAGGLTYRAFKSGLLDATQAAAFHDELAYLILHRHGALEIALLATAGLDWAYGIEDNSYKPRQNISSFKDSAKGGVCIPIQTPHQNMLRRISLLGEAAALSGEEARLSVLLPIENAESARLIGMKRQAEIDAVAARFGRKMLTQAVHHVMDSTDRSSLRGFEPEHNQELQKAIAFAKGAGVSDNFINLAIDYARQGYEEVVLSAPNEADDAEDRLFTALSVPDAFIESALTGHGFMIYDAGKPLRQISASKLFDKLCESLWQSGEPGVFFRDAVLSSTPCADHAPLIGHSVSGGYVFASDTQAPSATLNLAAFYDPQHLVRVGDLRHAARILTIALDAACKTSGYRPICLSLTNIPAVLMSHALAYDSDEGRAAAALAVAVVSGACHLASAEMAEMAAPFPNYARLEKSFLQVLKDKAAGLAGTRWMQGALNKKSAQVDTGLFPALAQAARQDFEQAYITGKEKGFRNAHLTAVDTDVDSQGFLGAQTRDIAPEKALVRFEGYFAEGSEGAEVYGKKLNPSVPRALSKLGYTPAECDGIHFYAVGHGTLFDAPHINHIILKRHGFHKAAIDALEAALQTAHHIRYVFNKWTLGEDFCRHMLGFQPHQIEDASFDMLSSLGFSEDEIEEANLYCCGAMTLEGAPHLSPEHIAIFDCASLPTPACVRSVSPQAQVRMQAALEPFLSGAVAHTIELEHFASIDDVQKLLLLGWEHGVKHLRISRHGSSLLHPVVPPKAIAPSAAAKAGEEENLKAPFLAVG